jgi:hypothetical protein
MGHGGLPRTVRRNIRGLAARPSGENGTRGLPQRARADAVTRSTAARWGLAGSKVLPASTGGVPRWRRARRRGQGHTGTVG